MAINSILCYCSSLFDPRHTCWKSSWMNYQRKLLKNGTKSFCYQQKGRHVAFRVSNSPSVYRTLNPERPFLTSLLYSPWNIALFQKFSAALVISRPRTMASGLHVVRTSPWSLDSENIGLTGLMFHQELQYNSLCK